MLYSLSLLPSVSPGDAYLRGPETETTSRDSS